MATGLCDYHLGVGVGATVLQLVFPSAESLLTHLSENDTIFVSSCDVDYVVSHIYNKTILTLPPTPTIF